MLSRSNGHSLKLRKGPSDNQRKLFHCENNWVLEQATQGDCGVSVPGGIQKSSGHWPGQTAPSGPAWAGDWAPWPTEVPANLNHVEILWNTMFKDTNSHIFFLQQAEIILTSSLYSKQKHSWPRRGCSSWLSRKLVVRAEPDGPQHMDREGGSVNLKNSLQLIGIY